MNGTERKCPICGRMFYITSLDQWAYKKTSMKNRKRRRLVFCSNKCMTAWLKQESAAQ